jgi:long-chain acyl-CoA synthetase
MARTSVIELLDYYRRHASETAFVQRRGYRRETWTYRKVLETACQFAHELAARSIRKGDKVMLWGENCAEWVVAFLGCMMRGVVVVPMDRVGSPDFARRVFQQVNGRLLVCSRELVRSAPGLPTVVLEDLAQAVSGREHSLLAVEISRSDALQIIFTSGTTTEPRGVVTSHGNVLANLEPFEGEIPKYLKYERWFHPIRFLDLVPLSHVFGQFMSMFIPPLFGGTVVFQDTLNPSEVVRTIKRERVSVLVAVPRLLESLKNKIERDFAEHKAEDWLSHQLASAANESAWKRWWRFRAIHNFFGWKFWAIVSGGATLDPATEEFWRRLAIVVLQGYGLTETTSMISVNHPFRRGRGSIGKVLPGRDIKLSEAGEILVRGEAIASHYWQQGELLPVAAAGEDGWFYTGDLGELDAEGFLHFKGRQKNVIVTPEGMKVYPEDLEGELRKHPDIRDAVVFGVQRGGNAEPAVAVLMRDASRNLDDVIRNVNRSLAPYQQIRHWYAWPESDFPRTATQKPRIGEIQQAALQHFAGAADSYRPVGNKAIADLISQVRGHSAAMAVDSSHSQDDLNLSSLERVELMCAVEDRYQIELNETTFAEIGTVADLEKLIAQPSAQTRRSQYHYPRWAQFWPVHVLRLFIYYLLSWPATYLLSWPRIIGRDNLRGVRGPVLVICNHVTYIDIGFVLAALPFRMRNRLAVAMEAEIIEQRRHPGPQFNFFRRKLKQLAYWLMTALFNVFPLPKLSGFRESFAFAGEAVDRGYNVLVFPEGRRTKDGKMDRFHSGIGLLAKQLNVPVVPLRIDGLWEAKLEGWRVIVPWRRILVRVGTPLNFSAEKKEEEIARELEQIMKAL